MEFLGKIHSDFQAIMQNESWYPRFQGTLEHKESLIWCSFCQERRGHYIASWNIIELSKKSPFSNGKSGKGNKALLFCITFCTHLQARNEQIISVFPTGYDLSFRWCASGSIRQTSFTFSLALDYIIPSLPKCGSNEKASRIHWMCIFIILFKIQYTIIEMW